MKETKIDVFKREPSWEPPFTLELEGKYIHLKGINTKYPNVGYDGKTCYEVDYLSPSSIQMHRSWTYDVRITSVTDTEITIEAIGWGDEIKSVWFNETGQSNGQIEDSIETLKQKQEKVCQEAIDEWGVDSQRGMAIEECAEFIVAARKLSSVGGREIDPDAKEAIINEIADVMIMMSQMRLIYGKEAVDERIDDKINRLEKRLILSSFTRSQDTFSTWISKDKTR